MIPRMYPEAAGREADLATDSDSPPRLPLLATAPVSARGPQEPTTAAGTRSPASGAARPGSALGDELAQHVLQDAAVAEVVRLSGGVDAHDGVEDDLSPVPAAGGDRDSPGRHAVVEGGQPRVRRRALRYDGAKRVRRLHACIDKA